MTTTTSSSSSSGPFPTRAATDPNRVRGLVAASLSPEQERVRWELIMQNRERDHRVGRSLAVAIAEYRETGDAALVTLRDTLVENDMVRVLPDLPQDVRDSLNTCEHCGGLAIIDELVEVRTGYRSSEIWCPDCVDNLAFTCDDCGNFCDDAEQYGVEGGSDVCPRCYNANYFTCDRCDRTLRNDMYSSSDCCDDCIQEEEDSSDYLADYHATERRWQTNNRMADYPFKQAPPMGMEIEVYADPRKDAVSGICDFISGDWQEWGLPPLILEKDSSLDEDCGFEIITHPMGLSEWQEYGPGFVKELRNMGVLAWDAEGGKYGIHLTVSRQYLSPLQEARLMMFLAATDNLDFVTGMAQRTKVYAANMDLGSLSRFGFDSVSPKGSLSCKYRQKYVVKVCGAGKYAPINFKNTLAEFRIFQSTLNPHSFMKNVEFVAALLEWTSPISATGSAWYYEDFLRWLQKRPLARKHYPSLLGYLERDTFPIKGVGGITNKYKEYLPRQTLVADRCEVEGEMSC